MPFFLLSLTYFLTIAGFFSQYGLWFDLAAHFRLQYLIMQILAIAIFCIQKRSKWLALTTVFAIINLSMIIPSYVPTKKSAAATLDKSLRILISNVNIHNKNYQKLTELILGISPDIISLEEINESWVNNLKPALIFYPYSKIVARKDGFGIGLFSKVPLESAQVKYFSDVHVPSIIAKIQWEGQPLTIIATHPVPPVSELFYQYRGQQFKEIIQLKSSFEKNIIILGDLNTTSWTSQFQDLKRSLDLQDSRKGFGLQASWPSFLPVGGIALDHCLLSKDFFVLDRLVGPNIGSDHRPVFIEVTLQKN